MPTDAAGLSARSIVPEKGGGPEVLRLVQRAVGPPGPGQVLIRVSYAGINRHDCGQRQRGASPGGATDTLGLEVEGEIIAVGAAVGSERVGERVCALVNGGGYAEYCVADDGLALTYPPSLSAAEAAALPEALFTCWLDVVRLGELKSGDWLLVHGGTSGVGSITIQVARFLGARVVATSGTQEKCDVCLRLGAEAAINYRTEDFPARVREITGGHGADVILDMVGGRYAEANLVALAMDGRIVHLSSGAEPTWSAPLRLIMEKRARVTGSLLRPTDLSFKLGLMRELKAQVWPELGHRVRPVIDRIIPLHEAGEAHRRMESGLHIGKLLLDVNGGTQQ